AHELCNTLSRLNLSLHLVERLLENGQEDEARTALRGLPGQLATFDRDWVMKSFGVGRSRRPCRALVVEDDANERELLAGLLNMNGCQCETAPDGQAALDYLASHEKPDLVLMDMWMPRRNGRDAVRAIRDNPAWRGVKVFSISSTPPEEVGLERGPEGIDAWFPKPLNPKTLWQ